MVKKFTPIAWGAMITIGVVGLLRAFISGFLNTGVLMGTTYGNTLLLKMISFVLMILVAIMITRTSATIPTLQPQEIPATQARIATLAKTNMVLGMITILLAVF